MLEKTCYECGICYGVNHNARLHCQYCGTIPVRYSMIGVPAVLTMHDDTLRNTVYTVVRVAFGALRQCSHRTIKRVFRTVAADYYATE